MYCPSFDSCAMLSGGVGRFLAIFSDMIFVITVTLRKILIHQGKKDSCNKYYIEMTCYGENL